MSRAGRSRERAAPGRTATGPIERAVRGRHRAGRVSSPTRASGSRCSPRLASSTPTASVAAQSRLLLSHIDDVWMQRAALSAGSSRAATYLDRVLDPSSGVTSHETPGRRTLFHDLGASVGARRQRAGDRQASLARSPHGRRCRGLVAGAAARRAGRSPAAIAIGAPLEGVRAELLALTDRPDASLRRASLSLLRISGLAIIARRNGRDRPCRPHRAFDRRADAARRADAIALLALAGAASRRTAPLVTGRSAPARGGPGQRDRGALDDQGRGDRSAGPDPMVRADARRPLGPRRSAAATPERQRILVDAIARGTVQPWAMTFWQKRDLLMNDDAAIRASARALLEESPERAGRHRQSLRVRGRARRRRRSRTGGLRAHLCAACHHLGGGTSADVGPDLATIRHRPPLSLLVDILSPSQSIAQGYETYLVRAARRPHRSRNAGVADRGRDHAASGGEDA